jgi:hypothetical protein
MRTLGLILLNALHQLALSLWLGGIFILGAVAAPAVFGTAKRAGDTHWGMPLYTFAATAMGEAFRRFNWVVLVAGAVMLLAGLVYGVLAGVCRKCVAARAALTVLAWTAAAWLTFSLFPQMMEARAAGQTGLFDTLHKTYSAAYSAQALLLLGVMMLTGRAQLDRTRSRTTEEAEPSPPPALASRELRA